MSRGPMVGGRNTVLNDAIQKTIRQVSDRPTLILGADVTHAQPGEDLAVACCSLEEGYLPKVTFVVVQKRHHTRFFSSDRSQTDKSGNIMPGDASEMGSATGSGSRATNVVITMPSVMNNVKEVMFFC
ncbi:hypothetical protein RIF29_29071 [Crotalaria pallida]|uniref:Piwi domain-containing protein n=1 Tax=Crotalaria pallida TaxID=3830 RepID=A0AAN9I007_CROPI